MDKNIKIILISLSLISCTNLKNNQWFDNYSKQVEKEVFENFLGNGKEILQNDCMVQYPSQIPISGVSYIFVKSNDLDKPLFEKQQNKIKELSLFEVNNTNDTLVNSFIKFYKRKNEYIPVPELNFFKYDEIISDSLLKFISPKARETINSNMVLEFVRPKVFVTNFKQGAFVKNKKYRINKKIIENGIHHGFTNGAILEEKSLKIVYYLIIW